MKTRTGSVAMLAAALGVALWAALQTGALTSAPPRESASSAQQAGPAPAAVAAPGPGRVAEPRRLLREERDAVDRALSGEAQPAPRSVAVAGAVARLSAQGPPQGELFALIKVTDRITGERQVFVRGMPRPELSEYLANPEAAPPGEAYSERESILAEAGVEIVTRSVYVHAVDAGPAHITADEEEERKLRLRNSYGPLHFRLESGLRGRVARKEIDVGQDDLVPVIIEITGAPALRLPKAGDPAPGGLIWVGLEIAEARERAIIERKKAILLLQADLLEAIEQSGGEVRYASWTSGSFSALVPASSLEKLAGRSDVFSIEYDEPQRETDHRWQGDDYHVAWDLEDFEPWHMGANGLSSKHSYTSRVVMAMGEQCIDAVNPAFMNGGAGSFNRGWYYDCDPAGVCTQGGVEDCTGTSTHGTRVAQCMAGDFMDGQDPGVAAGTRRLLTGTCPECRFFFLQDQNLNQRTKVLDAACDLGVDIFQSSISSIALSCDGNGSYDGTLQDLINCDALYVQSAGNEDSDTGSCTTTYPGDHPWTLTVGGVDTEDPCDTSGAWYTDDCIYDQGASRGGATYDGDAEASVIDLAGPYRTSNAINVDTSNPVTYGSTAGTSFASPLVAGVAARFMDWWNIHVSTSIFYDNRARNIMMLFGDRSSGSSGVTRLLNDTSVFWGAGRIGLVPFDDKNTWSLHRSSRTLSPVPFESWTFDETIPSGATFFKAVVWHTGTDYSDQPMIHLELNPGGCNAATVAVDRLDSKVVLVLTGLNSCESVQVTIENILAGVHWDRKFHYAAYSDTEQERSF